MGSSYAYISFTDDMFDPRLIYLTRISGPYKPTVLGETRFAYQQSRYAQPQQGALPPYPHLIFSFHLYSVT
jgi:hypothetical protein